MGERVRSLRAAPDTVLGGLAEGLDVGVHRQSMGMTQEQFAEWMGVDVRTVQRWEGRGAPVMVRLALAALDQVVRAGQQRCACGAAFPPVPPS
jgi:DNA-binding transcriptional regulator YiaG